MSEKIKSWDDIPSLGEVEVDWEFTPVNPHGKRKNVRMDNLDLASLFDTKTINVKLIVKQQNVIGPLLDIGEGGIGLNLANTVPLNQYVKIGFFLGKQKIISRALVRHCSRYDDTYKVGLQFIHFSENNRRFIAGLYAAKVLAH